MPQGAVAPRTLNFDGIPDATTPGTADTPPRAPGGLSFIGIPDATKPATVVNNDLPHQFGRQVYAAIPAITSTAGAALAAAPFVLGAPFTAGASPFAAPAAGVVGAGAGGIVGRGIQWIIDSVLNRDPLLQNPASAGDEATKQMLFEAGGQAAGAPLSLIKGAARPLTKEAAERAATAAQYDLKLSTPEITGGTFGTRVQFAGARGIAGQVIQQRAKQRTQQAVDRAVAGILDTLGKAGTPTEAGAVAQDAVQTSADRAGRRVEGAIATTLAPPTGTAATGRTTTAGVQAGRRGFSQIQQQFNDIVADGPDVDIRPLKSRALQIFHEQIMPALQTVPDFGPNTKTFARLKELYQAGNIVELGAETEKLLNSEALKSSTSPAIKTIRRVLTAQDLQPFNAATKLRTALRESGKAPDELLGTEAKGISTTLATTLRGILADAHPAWDAASQAYGTDARLFQTSFLRNMVSKDPESVLSAVTGAAGDVNATRVQQLRRVLLDVAKQSPDPADHAAGQQAWDTLRAEWFRRQVFQNNVFGLSDRMGKVDPAVLRAWFPDVPGKQVVARATQAATQFENTLLRQVADADPSKVLDLVGATPSRVVQLHQALTSAPQGPQSWNQLRRAWTERTLTAGDPAKLATRIDKADPDMLKAWFPTVADQQSLSNLRRIGAALSTSVPVPQRGLYESVEATSLIGALLTGNVPRAFKIAAGFEGVPALLSWSVYNPQIQQYLLDASSSTLPVTTRTAALLKAAGAWRAAQQTDDRVKATAPDAAAQ